VRESADVTIRMTRDESSALAFVLMALAPSMAMAERMTDATWDEMLVGCCALMRLSDALVLALGGVVQPPNAAILSIRAAAIGAEKRMAARGRLGDS